MLRLLLTGIACALLLACASQPPATGPGQPPEAAAAPPPAPPPPPERAIPDDSVYPLLLAEFALRRGAFDVALEQYSAQAPLLRDPGVSAHTTHLAQYLAREQEALEAAQLWVELEPDNLEANNTLAILLIRQGRNVQALPHFALLARAGEEVNFPTVLNDFEQLSPAEQAELSQGVERLAREMPDNTQVLLTWAMIQAETRQFEASLATLQQVFALEPDQKQAALLEAKILMAQGSTQPFARLERMLAANPQDTQVRLQYARMLTATDLVAAQEQFEVLSNQAPRNGELLLSLALLNRETGDNAAAKNYLRQLLALEQHVDEAHYYLGRIAEEDGDPQAAIYEYKQVEEGREFVAANGRLGLIYISSGQLDEYGAHFDQLRREYPDRLEQLYGVEADLLARENEIAAALAVINEALQQMPDSTALRYARAMLAEELGDLALLESDLRRIIAEEPDNATAMNALGYTLANRTRRYEEAYGLISQALALQPNEPAIMDSMGWVLYRMNRNEEALDYLARAYAAFPDPEVAAHLGEVLWVSGDTGKAMQVWQGALLKDPDNPVLVETLQRLEVTGLELPGLELRPDTGNDNAKD
ncbi:MAG: tetratricopeptide repeat protein [Pseudomonadales bacterium]|nr:tetratricopeptide repeat protein [Pseudomonadales bacterium]MCP5167353.1 tetratricopeptide repeat protein [Pseudomonadales bacterium]